MLLRTLLKIICICGCISSNRASSAMQERDCFEPLESLKRSWLSCFYFYKSPPFLFLSQERDDWQIMPSKECHEAERFSFLSLPSEIIEYISFFSSPKEIINLLNSCNHLYNLFSSDDYWLRYLKFSLHKEWDGKSTPVLKYALSNYYYLESIKNNNSPIKRKYIEKSASLGHPEALKLVRYWRNLEIKSNRSSEATTFHQTARRFNAV